MPPRKRTEPSTPDADAPVADVPNDEPTEPEAPDTEQRDRAPGEPDPATVMLAVAWPHDSFTVVTDGEPDLEITADGTAVPVDREKDIRAEAKDAGVTIRKVN